MHGLSTSSRLRLKSRVSPGPKSASAPLDANRDIDLTLTESTFEFIRDSLARRVAISLTDDKEYLVINRLVPVLRRHKIASLDALVLRLRMASDDPLWDEMVDALTTNETSFFRDETPFSALSETVLPAIYSKAVKCNRGISIWSAGCSSGQEAYSIAMLILKMQPGAADRLSIIGSDVSDSMLRRAAEARYSPHEVTRGLGDLDRGMFFCQADDGWEVTDGLKRLMRWEKFSLVDTWPPLPVFDLVLLRNVLVYFDSETRNKVLGRVRHVMRPGSVLMLGTPESIISRDGLFDRVNADGATYYVAK